MPTSRKNLSRLAFATLGALCLLGLPHLRAQTASPAPTAQPTTAATGADEAVRLTPFVVSESEDRGYAATSTLAGTRLRTDLRDVGAAISVVTSQFMIDTGSTNLRDILIYTTNTEAGGFEGNFSGVSTGNGFSSAEGTLQSPSGATRVRGLSGADLIAAKCAGLVTVAGPKLEPMICTCWPPHVSRAVTTTPPTPTTPVTTGAA
jgi:hypothetical protein